MSLLFATIAFIIVSAHAMRLKTHLAKGGKRVDAHNATSLTLNVSRSGGCSAWGTSCKQHSIYGGKIMGRNRVARECNLDENCVGVVFVAEGEDFDSIGQGWGKKCDEAGAETVSDKRHQYCEKDRSLGHVAPWDRQEQITGYVMETMGMAVTAEKSHEFLKALYDNTDTKQLMTMWGTLGHLEGAMKVTEHLKTVLMGVQGLMHFMAFAGVINSMVAQPFFIQILDKLGEIKSAMTNMEKGIQTRFTQLAEIASSQSDLNAVVTTTLGYVHEIRSYEHAIGLLKKTGVDMPSRMLDLYKKIVQLQFSVMGSGSTIRPYFDEHLKFLREGIYSIESAKQPGYSKETLVDRMLQMSARFNEFIGVQADGIRVLGALLQMYSEVDEQAAFELKGEYTIHITNLLENIAIQQKRHDPIHQPEVRGTLSFIFTEARLLGSASEGLLGLCDIRAEIQLLSTQEERNKRNGRLQAFWAEVATLKQGRIFSEEEVDSMLEMCGAAYLVLNKCLIKPLRAQACFPHHARVLTRERAFVRNPFTYVGPGVAGPYKQVATEGVDHGQGKRACYKAIMQTDGCSKDYFSVLEYGLKGGKTDGIQACLCKTDGNLDVMDAKKGGDAADFYAVAPLEEDEVAQAKVRPPLMTTLRFELFYKRATAALRAAQNLKESQQAKVQNMPMMGMGWGGMTAFGTKGGHEKAEAERIRTEVIAELNKVLMALL